MWFLGVRIDPAAIATAELTYAERGATRGPLPPGYHHVSRREHIGTGRAAFHRAAKAVMSWRMHRVAGLVRVYGPPAAEAGSVVLLRLGPPILGVAVPCRVVYTVEEPDRCGFAYGTLPGHAESGEEAFVVERGGDGEVFLDIRAFSRPATLLARAGGPFTRAGQAVITSRYVRALRRLSQQ